MQEEAAAQPEPPSRKRLDEIFGRDLGLEEPAAAEEELAREHWYRENRPPHHDG